MASKPLLVIDPGHGGKDSGAVANRLREKDLTLNIAKRTKAILEAEYNVDVRLTRTTDVFIGLSQRANFANALNADYFCSIHINAGGGTGYEDYIYNRISPTGTTGKMRAKFHREVFNAIASYGVKERGMKSANYAVLRETKMPAVLSENLFIDTVADANLLKKDAFLNAVARGHANGLAKAMDLAKKAAPSKTKISSSEKSSSVKMVVVKDNPDGWLWTYNSANWDDKAKKVKPGEAFTVVGEVIVNGAKMYKLKSGLYITASPKYVTVKRR